MCINCPEIDENSADEVKPDSDRNRAVTCASGQFLTIEYESGGTKRVPVTSLTCSSEFAWETTGGTFPGYPSFDELNKAIKWKARCIPPTSGVGPACQALPYDASSAVCGSKYDCYEPVFKNGEVPAKMECDDPGALRRTADIEKIAPTCKNGAWTENGVDFEKTTKVMCINCPDIITNLADEDLPKSEGNSAVTCDKGQLTIEYERDGLRQVPVSSLTCSSEFAWSATGGPFPGFSSFTDLNNEIGWKARCIKPATGDCHSCTKALVSITKNSAGSHDFESDNIDQSGTCAVLSFICKGTSANIEFNKGGGVVMDGEDGAVDGVAKLTLVCNADGTAWKPVVVDMPVTQVECASLGG
ncbi:hypothetical protein PRIPAC_92394 [Pristionchus pacificus]|uniref:Uncharacterized protein n=1 Tax=Pristionchus pacificus TaxID=54126 RepID=A0A2A6CHI8_PRIPA|nr:hypothetical protein PRIPAC_92394 [Pristionchus pacificus]|eukprot:PDM77538.1 hypothetical protein PRIPAC_34405 [Pristionchus pacificus]